MDVSQYEQTHNMMQVWTGMLSELQLPERALAQLCHTRIDALSLDKHQFHLLLHQNSHHSNGQTDERSETNLPPNNFVVREV